MLWFNFVLGLDYIFFFVSNEYYHKSKYLTGKLKGKWNLHERVGSLYSISTLYNCIELSFFIICQVKPKPGKNTSLKKFHSQYYVNGSECDLTGKARETQIKVFCIMTVLTPISTYIFSRLISILFLKN